MAWLIDGSNVLGVMRLDRNAVESKRELARVAASFARAKRTKVTLFFDGPEPPSFGRHLGNATIVFTGKREADDVIVEQVASMRDAHVVTSDGGLTSRVNGRRVDVIEVQQFLRVIESLETRPENTSSDDW